MVLRGNDITNDNTAICVHIGSNAGYGIARDVVIDSNRIFNCGRLPATGFDHGIYVNNAYDTRITNNFIYDNADYGVHLYPGAQRSVVAGNVIDGNGRGLTFSGDGGLASSDNVVEYNIISNSLIRYNVESWWGSQVGTGNRAERNCLWNGRLGNIASQWGFTATDNLNAEPMFVDRATKDFRLRDGSPCAGTGPRGALTPRHPLRASGRCRRRRWRRRPSRRPRRPGGVARSRLLPRAVPPRRPMGRRRSLRRSPERAVGDRESS